MTSAAAVLPAKGIARDGMSADLGSAIGCVPPELALFGNGFGFHLSVDLEFARLGTERQILCRREIVEPEAAYDNDRFQVWQSLLVEGSFEAVIGATDPKIKEFSRSVTR